MYDLVIKNATIVDGAKTPRYAADIGIRGDRIAAIGSIDASEGREVLEAEGRIVAPGVVDVHTHYDAQIFWDPTCADSGQNGVTTVVTTNCGFGFAPCRPQDRERYMAMMTTTEQISMAQMRIGLPWSWETYPEFLDAVETTAKAVNVSCYVPLNPLLIYVMGVDAAKTRRPTAAELDQLKALVHEGMDAGALGVSFVRLGTLDSHTDFDGTAMPTDMMHADDAAAISSVLGERGEGVVMALTQLSDIGDAEVSEQVARAIAGRPLLHNAVGTSEDLPDLHRKKMRWLDEVRDEGLNVYMQAAVSRAWSEYDAWVLEGSTLDFMEVSREFTGAKSLEEKMAVASDPDFRRRWRADYDPRKFAASQVADWVLVSLGETADPDGYAGKSFGEIGALRGTDFVDAFFDMAVESNMGFTFKRAMDARDPVKVVELISHPFVLSSISDGGAHSKFVSGGPWPTDLITWLVRDTALMSLEDIHHRFSGLPAGVLGFTDRGVIAEGAYADLVVYSLDELYYDRTGYEVQQLAADWRRRARAGGYRAIIVNGEVTWENDVRRDANPGKLLRVGRPQDNQRMAAE